MKKLLTIIALLALGCGSACAKDFALRKAFMRFVKDKSVTVKRQDMRGTDPADEGGREKVWNMMQYTFRLPVSRREKLNPIIAAYDIDRNRKEVGFAVYNEGQPVRYSLPYSNRLPPIQMEQDGSDGSCLLIAIGNETEGINTVLGMQWQEAKAEEDGAATLQGIVLIMERDPAFAANKPANPRKSKRAEAVGISLEADTVRVEMLEPDTLAIDTIITDIDTWQVEIESENIRRLHFYTEKYVGAVAKKADAISVLQATMLVVDEVIRKGTAQEKRQAREALDDMLMATPMPNPDTMTPSAMSILNSQTKIILNLQSRLASSDNNGLRPKSPHTFTIEGTVDDGLLDIGYYVYTSGPDMVMRDENPQVISVTGQHFSFQQEMDDVRLGKVRALMNDGTVCSAWIELLFVPGETAELNVHNGTYTLSGTGFYQQWENTKTYYRDAVMKRMKELETAYQKGQREVMSATSQVILDMLAEHSDEPGVFCFVFKEGMLTSQADLRAAYNLLSPKLQATAYGTFLRKYLE